MRAAGIVYGKVAQPVPGEGPALVRAVVDPRRMGKGEA